MLTQVARWGNSLALRIPSAYAREIAVEEGKAVELNVLDGKMVVTPVEDIPTYDINNLVALITTENLHDETDFGPAVGNEAW